ncbi:hypothetical protein D9758_010821 [Tetrapyrgos nigripes]|uniref:Uncharacterized protein n=1 Tax=Tetrapyrgos nigripes TaxID=182062 RepID=A0A8H5GI38_9AGAR|nr:hypothetical protein D9758_010821 [Tetrapyrgos nigripes]
MMFRLAYSWRLGTLAEYSKSTITQPQMFSTSRVAHFTIIIGAFSSATATFLQLGGLGRLPVTVLILEDVEHYQLNHQYQRQLQPLLSCFIINHVWVGFTTIGTTTIDANTINVTSTGTATIVHVWPKSGFSNVGNSVNASSARTFSMMLPDVEVKAKKFPLMKIWVVWRFATAIERQGSYLFYGLNDGNEMLG